jgi:hypothetical protein
MTDEHLDRLVRDADPYRPDVLERLDGADQALLDQITTVRVRRTGWRRTTGALVAASVLVGALTVSAVLRDKPAQPPVAPTAAAASPGERGTTLGGTPVVYSAAVLKAAEDNPRLLIDQPGWKATTVYGFAEDSGTIAFDHGDRQLEMNWYPDEQYQGYYTDRLEVSAPEKVQVAGSEAALFRYSDSDFAAMLRPRGKAFVELRTGGSWTRSQFDKVLQDIVRADVRTWLAALPETIVTPDRVADQAAKILAGVPLPPGFDAGALQKLGTNDPYQFGAEVTARVGCGWIAAWLQAENTGDQAALRRAADALRSSHGWQVLIAMKDDGGWSDVFWEVADDTAAGHPPGGYVDALGCE